MRRSAEAVYMNTMPRSSAVSRRERKAARLRADKKSAIKIISLVMLGMRTTLLWRRTLSSRLR